MGLLSRFSRSGGHQRLERRLSPRRNVNIEAEIEIAPRQTLPCVVRNVSDTGAKIEIAFIGRVPNRFVLLVPGHHPQTCRVIWRALREMGVEYQP